MGNRNPFSDGGQSGRVDDIKAQYASGAITQDQYNELVGMESVTSNFLNLKRVGALVLFGTIGFFLIWANL